MHTASVEVIDLAATIELECAALYEVYARCFGRNEEMAQFWGLYAEAERYHHATIRIHQASIVAGGDSPGSAEVDPSEARTFLEALRKARTDAERKPPTIAEALERARWVEEQSAELHGRAQFFRNYPALAELFQSMAEEDRNHREVLAGAAKRWGVTES